MDIAILGVGIFSAANSGRPEKGATIRTTGILVLAVQILELVAGAAVLGLAGIPDMSTYSSSIGGWGMGVLLAFGGHALSKSEVQSGAGSSEPSHSLGQEERRRHTVKVLAYAALGTVVAVAALIIFTFATAEHWTKVDVPEHPATFHTEEYLTGEYDVVDDKADVCWVGQYWTDCINAHVDEFNHACAGVSLTFSARFTCNGYSSMIDRMKADDDDGWGTVASLGSYGHLRSSAVTATREVSNNDYRPEVTHEAVCYLSFFGECE
ncbi:hypothetical protein ACDF64_12105 [Agromyces sp. MMS24-JH15]|uniref:hypothetical protein n=1 Tax=Agromyces sp. MMS24-JH15 TaxID=3243765 RepID=UPI003749DFD2